MATIGQPLTAPESGWKRYDSTESILEYSSSWTHTSGVTGNYQSTSSYTSTLGSKVKFSFFGTKIRLIASNHSSHSSSIQILIDGVSETFSQYQVSSTAVRQVLVYEKTGLLNGIHKVEIISGQNTTEVDAIDIDSTGYLTATIGQSLLSPESGWTRYDNTHPAFVYNGGGWATDAKVGYYQGSAKYTKTSTDSVKFTFTGTKFRILAVNDVWSALTATIKIDGVPQDYTQFYSNGNQVLVFEKTGLEKSSHTIEIIATGATSTLNVNLDAIDIDATGRLYHPDEVTDIKDLSIGKRIRCHYQSLVSGAVGTFSGLGKETSDFIPAASSATPNGDFYCIFVEDWNGQKKLIADRNIQHSISWDVLNTSGIASGSGLPLTEIQGIGFFSSVIFVDSMNGSDTNIGSAISPVKTINKALTISSQGGAIRFLDGIHTINTTNMYLHDLCTTKGLTFVGNGKSTILEVPSCPGSYAQGAGTSAYFWNMIIRRSDSGTGETRMLWYSNGEVPQYKLRFYNVGFTKSPNGAYPTTWHFTWSPSTAVNVDAYFDNCSFVSVATAVEYAVTTGVVRYRNCAFGNSSTMSSTLGCLFNSTFDSSSTLNISSGNWKNAGVGYNPDGTAVSIGVYGGSFDWSTFNLNKMDETGYQITTRLLTGGISATDKDNEWDKYIVGSTLNGTITAGDNNVWNYMAGTTRFGSWTSTTNSVKSAERVLRPNPGGSGVDPTVHSSSLTNSLYPYNGFRPVLLIDSVFNLQNKSFILFNGEYKKWVEGTPTIEESFSLATPKMTSNTTPSGRVFSETVFSSAYDAWMVFNQVDDGEGYASGNGSGGKGFLGYQFPSEVVIAKYVIRSMTGSNHLGKMPKDWSFEGSNDSTNGTDGTWVVLDSRTSQIWTTITTDKEYFISNPQSFITYRLRWTANNGVASYTDINELKMYSYTPYVPAIPSSWKTISTTLPSVDTFKSEGMSDLTVLDRKSTTFTFAMDDNGTGGSVLADGRVYKKRVDFKKLFDIKRMDIK